MRNSCRKKVLAASAAFLVSLGILFAAPRTALIAQAAPTAEEQEKMDRAAEQKKKLEAEREKTKSMISELNSLKSDLSAYVKKLDADLTGIQSEIDRLDGKIGGKEQELDSTEQELQEAEELRQRQYGSMKLRIKYMYEKGNTGFLDLLLSSRNLSELFNYTEYVQKISSYDRNQLDLYAANCQNIRDKKQKIEEEKADLESLRSDESAKQESVQALMSEKQKQIASYAAQIGDAQEDLSGYEDQIEAEESEIRAVEEQVKKREEEERKKAEEERKKAEEEARRKAEESAAGKKDTSSAEAAAAAPAKSLGNIRFTWPCPASSRVTSGFGKRSSPTKGASSNHQGIDISAGTGSAIVAAADGDVVIATYSSSSGNYVMLSHGGGVYTLYLHCSSLNCSVGQHVSAGQTIAKVGSTGISTGPHLHFGLRSGGSYLNPLSYVRP